MALRNEGKKISKSKPPATLISVLKTQILRLLVKGARVAPSLTEMRDRTMEQIVALANKWAAEADLLSRRGDERGGRLMADLSEELAEAILLEQEEPLTLS